jgi:2-amino-4-hydroxy-6-hydroxymethyldihydropteridine diphosphokinase
MTCSAAAWTARGRATASSACAGSASVLLTPAAVALGSNLGDRRAHLAYAADRLGRHLSDIRMSPAIETDPVDVPDPQPPYLNAVAIGTTALSAEDLLAALLAIERERGRTRPYAHAPRTLDLDLILFGDLVINTPALTLPHPRFRERRFVLEPLAKLAADWIDPVTGVTVTTLLARLDRQREP